MNRIALTILFFIVPCLCFIAAGQSPNNVVAASTDLNNYSLLGIISLVIGGAFKLINSLTKGLTDEIRTAINNNTEAIENNSQALYETKKLVENLAQRVTNLEQN